MSSKYTFEHKNQKEVAMKKTTRSKLRVTFMLAVSSDGSRYPPYIIMKSKNKKEPINQIPQHSILRQNSKGINSTILN